MAYIYDQVFNLIVTLDVYLAIKELSEIFDIEKLRTGFE